MRRRKKSIKRVSKLNRNYSDDAWQMAKRQAGRNLTEIFQGLESGLIGLRKLDKTYKVFESIIDPRDPDFKHWKQLYLKTGKSLQISSRILEELRDFTSKM